VLLFFDYVLDGVLMMMMMVMVMAVESKNEGIRKSKNGNVNKPLFFFFFFHSFLIKMLGKNNKKKQCFLFCYLRKTFLFFFKCLSDYLFKIKRRRRRIFYLFLVN